MLFRNTFKDRLTNERLITDKCVRMRRLARVWKRLQRLCCGCNCCCCQAKNKTVASPKLISIQTVASSHEARTDRLNRHNNQFQKKKKRNVSNPQKERQKFTKADFLGVTGAMPALKLASPSRKNEAKSPPSSKETNKILIYLYSALI